MIIYKGKESKIEYTYTNIHFKKKFKKTKQNKKLIASIHFPVPKPVIFVGICYSSTPFSASVSVLVSWGCYNKVHRLTGWLINHRNLFLTIPKTKFKIRVPVWLSSPESPLPD